MFGIVKFMAFILTLDDGPSELAQEKLAYLNSLGIKAVWFCLGANLEQRPEIALHVLGTGHIIANHSYSHPHFSQISIDQAREEITHTDQVINKLYKHAGVRRPVKLFRFPYGDQGDGEVAKKESKLAYKKQLEQFLNNEGFSPLSDVGAVEFYGDYANRPGEYDWLWSYDIQEWAIGHENGLQLSINEVKNNLRQYLSAYNKNLDQVILMHDHERTNQYFSELIRMMKDDNKFELPNF